MIKYIKKNNKKGFTLIELVVYMALFSIMMGGLIIVVFQLIQSSKKLSSKDVAQEEINFVIRKIDWALTDASSVTTSTTTMAYDTLNIVSFSGGKKVFRLNNSQRIEFCQNTINTCTDFNLITTQNLKILGLSFLKINTTPQGVTMTLNVNGIITTYTKYLRL